MKNIKCPHCHQHYFGEPGWVCFGSGGHYSPEQIAKLHESAKIHPDHKAGRYRRGPSLEGAGNGGQFVGGVAVDVLVDRQVARDLLVMERSQRLARQTGRAAVEPVRSRPKVETAEEREARLAKRRASDARRRAVRRKAEALSRAIKLGLGRR